MFKKAKHVKQSANKKRINILLSILLVICLVFVGTVLGKYIIDKTIGEKINLNIAGTPQGNVLIGEGGYDSLDEYNENYGFVPTAGFAYQIQQLMDNNGKTLGDVTKIVFDTAVPSGIDTADTTTKIDVSHGGREKIFAYYNSAVDQSTVYVVPEELPTDGISYPMMAHENATAMFAGLYNLKTIEGLENVFLDNINDANNMFLDCRTLTAVDLSHWTAEKLTDMHYMFAYCMSLKSLDLTSFHTINVEYMNSVFWECEALETIEIDTEKFVTDKVVDTSDMFGNCNSLKAIDVSGFDTSSVEIIYGMFQSCYLLENIDVSSFDIDKVTDLSDMFLDCDALKTLDLSSWDTSNVTTMWRMFSSCEALEKLDLSTFNTGNVTDMSSMFSDCTSLNKLYLTGWNTEKVTNMYEMFENCYSLEKLDLSSFNTANVETMRHMFAGCGSLQTIYASENWSTEKVVNTEDDGDDYIDEFEAAENELFTDCWALTGGQGTYYGAMGEEDPENYNHKKYAVIDKAEELQEDGVTYGEKGYLTLYEAYTLTDGLSFSTAFNNLQFENMDATTITFGSYNMLKQSGEIGDIWNDASVSYEIVDDKGQGTIRAYLITNDYGTGIYVVSKDSSVIFANQDCSYMFDTLMSMVSLTNIWGLNNVDTRNTTNMSFMFSDNTELIDMDVSGFDTSNVTDMTAMFSGLYNLSWLDVSNFDTSNVTNMYGMFAYCESLYSLDVSGFDTSNVTNMQIMFDCVGLTTLDLSNWDTSKVTNMMSMFDGCENLQTIYAGAGWNTDNVTNHEKMFKDCTALVGGQGTSWAAMSTEDPDNFLNKKYALIDAAREPNGAKGYLTDADYGTKSKILLPGGEFNAELAALLAANETVTKVQFGEASQFSENLDFSVWDDTAWRTNADAVLDVARSGNISAFVVGDTVYVLAKEIDYEQGGVIFANQDSAEMFRHNVGDETGYIPSVRLTAIDGLSFVDTRNTTDMSYMFAGSSNLATVDLRSFNTAGVTNMSYMFYGCNSLGGLSLSGFDTGKVTNMASMFYDCDAITALKLTDWDVRNVTNMNSMFYGCDKLNTLNLTGWNTSFVTDMTAMFYGDSALTTVYVDESWKTGRVDESTDMFTGCTAIVGGQGTTFDEDYTDKEYAVIDRLMSDGAKGYLTYEEAYTLISGPDFSWMLWDGDGKDEYYGLSEDTIEWEGFDGGDVRITKIVFGSYDEYKDTLGLTSWDGLAPGIALDAEQEGNIRLYIPDFDWSNTQGDSDDQTYYVLSKGSSKIIANEDCSALLRSGKGWEEAYGLPWPVDNQHLEVIEGLDKLDTRYVTDMSMMFEYFAGESLDLSTFDTSNVTNMSGMFNSCSYLTSLDVTEFNTSNVTNMSAMFSDCSTLETIDVSKLDTSNVTDMSHMFNGMTSLTAVNVDNFDTSKVTDMSSMFSGLYVTALDLSNFNTANVTNMNYMFSNCYSLTDLDILSFDTGKVTNMEFMFAYCWELPQVDISSFSTTGADNAANASVTYVNIAYMFYDCKALTTIFASEDWDPDKVNISYYSQVFALDTYGAVSNLKGGEGTTWAETAGTSSYYNDYVYARIDEKVSSNGTTLGLFTDKNAPPIGDFTLKAGSEFNSVVKDLIPTSNATIQFGSWSQYGKTNGFEWQDGTDVGETANTIKAFEKDGTVYILSAGNMYANADSSYMFKHSYGSDTGYIPQGALTAINGLDKVNTSNVTDMSHMFEYCINLAVLDVTGFNTEKVTDMSWMFRDCAALTELNISSFDTSNVENMQEMFRYVNKLTTLDFSSEKFNTSKVTNMQGMFQSSSGLQTLDLSVLETGAVTNMSYMFQGCTGLTSLNVSFDTSSVTDMSYMFDHCEALQSLDVSSFNTSKVTTMQTMFNCMFDLTELKGLTSFDTANVTNMWEIFSNCNNITYLDLSSFDTSNVTHMTSMFYCNYKLKTIYVEDLWDISSLTEYNSSHFMFYQCYDLVGGAGTSYAEHGDKDASFAHIDGGESNPGYLTGPSATLTTGSAFNSAINDLFSESVTKLQFGTHNAFVDTVGEWNSSTTYVDVDNDGDGSPDGLIRVFTPTGSDTVYVLSKGISEIYANADSSSMFTGRNSSEQNSICTYLYEIKGLETVNTSNVTSMRLMFNYCQSLTSLDLSSFNTSSVETMVAMFQYCDSLTTLKVSNFDTSKVTDMGFMFSRCESLTSLGLTSFDTSKVTNMRYMFNYCQSLTSLDLSSFDTSNVTKMDWMFNNCQSLTSLDLSSFDTAIVTTMSTMFQRCEKLASLNVSSFDTSNVTGMDWMFNQCHSLTSLDLSNFDTRKVENMKNMFSYCGVLKTIYVSNYWSTANVSESTNMFQDCSALVGGEGTALADTGNVVDKTYAKIDKWKSESVRGYLTDPNAEPPAPVTLTTGSAFNTAINDLFSDTVTKLQFGTYNTFADKVGDWNDSQTFVDVDSDSDGNPDGLIRVFTPTGSDTVYVLSKGGREIYANADSAQMFYGGSSSSQNSIYTYLYEINGLETVNTSKVTNMNWMFNYCGSLTSLDLSSFNTSSVENMRAMFQYCDSLTTLNVLSFDTSKVTDMSWMFNHCESLTSLDLSSFDTSSVENMTTMFQYCDSLTTLNVSSFDTSKATDMSYMFNHCDSLTELDVSNFDTSSVENMSSMFQYCGNLTTLDVSGFDTSAVENMSYMFNHCDSLTELDVSNFDTSSVENMSSMFQYCGNLTTLDVSGFDTTAVGDMSYMFRGCSGLTALDVTSFNTTNVSTMRSMFNTCSKLTELDLTSFDTSNVTIMMYMFQDCSALQTIYVDNSWNTGSVTEDASMFLRCTALVGGEGTPFDSSEINATYARIDKAISEGTKGYLTGNNSAVLTTGSAFNGVIRDRFSSSVTKLQFGTYDDVAASNSTLANAWNNSTTYVDVAGKGTIRVFTSGDTVYVLSIGDSVIYANPDSGYMFRGRDTTTSPATTYSIYSYLKEINGLSAVNTSKVTLMNRMFESCSKLTELDVSGFDTSNVTNMNAMFNGLTLTELDISNFNTAKVTNMQGMFHNCGNLVVLDLSSFDTRSVTNMMTMFRYDYDLETIYVSELWSTDNVTNSTEMFKYCELLVGGAGTAYNESNVGKAYARIDGGTSNPGYFTDIAQKASASALSLDDVSATAAEESDTAADSTVEAILPETQTKEESESEQEADNPNAEEEEN